jgi:hypothetical protein
MSQDNTQLGWLKNAPADQKRFVGMVVGWQTVAETINATVAHFNAKFFQPGTGPHEEMKLIAAKQAVMASLKELLVGLGNWRDALARTGNLSEESKRLWKQLEPTLQQINQFKAIRNCAFHFGDYLEPPDQLAEMYESVRDQDIDALNAMLRALYDFGFQLRQDALSVVERLKA